MIPSITQVRDKQVNKACMHALFASMLSIEKAV